MDRGGPACRGLVKAAGSDFLFPQHTLGDPDYQGWEPGFVDYLFLAFTTATAFSPAEQVADVIVVHANAALEGKLADRARPVRHDVGAKFRYHYGSGTPWLDPMVRP